MKALLFAQHGDLDQVRFNQVDTPEVKPGLVLVRMRAAALNRLDLFVLGGLPGLTLEMPHIPGSDGAGTVEAIGDRSSRFSVGDRVMLNPVISCNECEFCISGEQSMCVQLRLVGEHTKGTFAEYFAVPGANLEKIPPEVSFAEAAAFSLVFQTAWRMLITRAQIQPAEDVFIHGIGGGVSSAALQIARLCGCRTFVSSSSQGKLRRAREMGADHCINYKKSKVVSEVLRRTGKRGVDVVVDSVGAETWKQSLQLVRKGGKLLTCGATTGPNPETDIRLIFWKHIRIIGSTMGNRCEYQQLLKLLGEGKLKPIIDKKYPLAEGRKALQYLSSQQQFGKVVLLP